LVSLIIRCIFTFALLAAIGHTTRFEGVDVLVPGDCLTFLGMETQGPADGTTCIYRGATVQGRVIQHDFEVSGPRGALYSQDARIVSRSNELGLTWRSVFLLLIVAAMWLPSLLTLPMGGSSTQRSSAKKTE
jgi:hypothetical protein